MPSPKPQFIELASLFLCSHVLSPDSPQSPCSAACLRAIHESTKLCATKLPTASFHTSRARYIYSSNVACFLLLPCFFNYHYLTSFTTFLYRTHLSWSVCPCPSPRERAWHVSVLVKTTVERRATSPCNHPLPQGPLAVLLTHIAHESREGERGL